MKIKTQVRDFKSNSCKDEILFEGELELFSNWEYAAVEWPKGSDQYHFIWEEEKYLEPTFCKDIDVTKTYFFYIDD